MRKITEATQTDPFLKDKSALMRQEETMSSNFRFRKKKTGKDAFTQINRFDFFNYEKEVKPMIEVLTTKTLEQSLVEVYEEEFLSQMQRFKENLYSKTKTKIIYENKKRKKANFSNRATKRNRKAENSRFASFPREIPAHPENQIKALEIGHRRRVQLTRFFKMVDDAAFFELNEESRLLEDQGNHVVVFTDFKDWLMDKTSQYVRGKNNQKKTFSSRVWQLCITKLTRTFGRWSSRKNISFYVKRTCLKNMI